MAQNNRQLLVVIPILFLAFKLQADPLNLKDWVGEWQSTAAFNHAHGISIKDCDKDLHCTVSTFGINSGINCLREGTSQRNPVDGSLRVYLSEPHKGNGCELQLTLNPNSHIVTMTREDDIKGCNLNLCEPLKPWQQRQYERKSQINFVGLGWSSPICSSELTPASRFWCTDREIQVLAEDLKTIPFLEMDTDLSMGHPSTFWLDSVIQHCDKANEPKSCLKGQYTQKREELLNESKQYQKLDNEEPGPKAEASQFIHSIEGVYKYNFPNSNIQGEQYQSENSLEVVKTSDTEALVKISLEFFNGHSCGLTGTFEYKKSGYLLFRDPEKRCLLILRKNEDELSFDDPSSTCRRMFCGARGGFSVKFKLDQKITQDKRLLSYSNQSQP